MKHRRNKPAGRVAAIEVCHSSLHIAVSDKTPGGAVSLSTRSVQWRREATSLYCETGVTELTAAMKELTADFQLEGAPVYLALDGDFCVTRVVTGTAKHVRTELDQLQERSVRYLSLGHGSKTLGECVREIDARHQYALLAVVNEKVLDALVDVVNEVGLKIQLIEPSLVSLCRFVGRTGRDTENPVLIVKLGKGGLEVGISHQGRLLLDYRPAGSETDGQVAAIVAKHLGRLQRYCDRYVRLTEGRLERVLLCGEPEAAEIARASFEKQGVIEAEMLDPQAVDGVWEFDSSDSGTVLAPVLGTCLLGIEPETEDTGPDLLTGLTGRDRRRFLPTVLKVFWPLAAALLVAVALKGLEFREQERCHVLEQEMACFGLDHKHVRELLAKIAHARERIGYLNGIKSKLSNPPWHELSTSIGQCLSDDTWVQFLHADSGGHVVLNGVSYSEKGLFDFMHWLRKHPEIDHVALHSTNPITDQSQRSIQFHIECDLAGSSSPNGVHDENG